MSMFVNAVVVAGSIKDLELNKSDGVLAVLVKTTGTDVPVRVLLRKEGTKLNQVSKGDLISLQGRLAAGPHGSLVVHALESNVQYERMTRRDERTTSTVPSPSGRAPSPRPTPRQESQQPTQIPADKLNF